MNKIGKEVEQWIRDVVKGKIVVSRFVRLACKRQQKDIKRSKKRSFPWKFDAARAIECIEFFPAFLKHSKGEFAGKPFELSIDQKFIVWCLFGWRNKKTKFRRFLRAFLTVARKWGKSTFCAGLAILLLFFDSPIEPDAEGYVAATKEKQASIVHKQAVQMVQANEALASRAKWFRNRDRYSALVLDAPPYNGSVFTPVGSDSEKSDGFNPHFVVKDELHAWQAHHKGLKERLETGGGARRQPLDLTISTNGDDQSTFFIQEDNAATSILEAVERDEFIADRVFAYIARLDEERPCNCGGEGCEVCVDGSCGCNDAECVRCRPGTIAADDPFDESNWPKANPNIGISPSWEFMREQAARAKREPDFKNSFLRFHCNVQVSSKVKLINPVIWSNNRRDDIDWSRAVALCGALDIGLRDDLASFGVAGRFEESNRVYFAFKCRSYICEHAKRKLFDEPWVSWIDKNWLIRTEGNTTDFQVFRSDLLGMADELGCSQWRYDPAHATQLGTELANDYGKLAVEFPQNFNRYNEPLRELIKQINDGNVYHNGDPVLAWAVNNAIGKKNSNLQMMPDKEKSKDKIDPFVCLVMAFSGVMPGLNVEPPPQVSTWYETNELEIG